jgi:PEP-CTERM motif
MGKAMSSLRRLSLLSVLSCLIAISTFPANADTVYDVTGAALLVGNNVCSGLPCTETIAFSLDFGWEPYLTEYEAYVSNLQAVGSGALGSFTINSGPGKGGFGFGGDPFLALFDAAGDEIDLDPGISMPTSRDPVASLTPSAPTFYLTLWSCKTMTCVTDFYPPDLQSGPPFAFGNVIYGTVQYTVTAVPEPSAIALLALGIMALAFPGIRRRWLVHRGPLEDAP